MKQYNLFGYQVEINENATKDWYEKSTGWSCDCGHCQNFLLLVKKKELPVAVLDTLKRFDIPVEKPTYVCEIDSEEGQILYQFSYRIAGNILEEGPHQKLEWGEARCCHEIYPYGAPDFKAPHFDLEFWVRLPWILKYSFSDIADYLMHGREIEFVYRGKECSITNHSSKWWFYDGERNIELCEFENKRLLIEKVSNIIIEDKTIREIFNENCYEESLYIL